MVLAVSNKKTGFRLMDTSCLHLLYKGNGIGWTFDSPKCILQGTPAKGRDPQRGALGALFCWTTQARAS